MRSLLLTVLFFTLAACAGDATPAPSPTPGAAADPQASPVGSWVLRTVNGQAPVGPTPPTLDIKPDGQAGGTGGCNSYGSQATISGAEITFAPAISTLMACADNNAMQQESAFFKALETVRRFQIAGAELTLLDGQDQPVLVFVKVP